MPSPKVQAAVEGKAVMPARSSVGKTAVRYSVVSSDQELARLQDDLRAQSDKSLEGTPFKTGKVMSGQITSGSYVELQHGFGTEARCMIVDVQPAADPPAGVPAVWRTKTSTARAKTHVRLSASEDCTVTVWLYPASGVE